jgi:hypothetical protein
MSTNDNGLVVTSGDTTTVELTTLNSIEPTIRDTEGREVTPAYTATLRGKTDNQNITHKSLCGQTETESVGEDEWNVTMEGLVLKEQLDTLFEMRPASNKITIVGDARTHRNIDFDRFIYEQRDELNTGQFVYEGREVEQPLFDFQLQTRDDDQ